MTLFPLAAAVTVVLNGYPVRGYTNAFEIDGRIFAPVRPYVTLVADRVWYSGNRVAIERGGRVVYVRVDARGPDALDRAFVPLRRIIQALGAEIRYDGATRIAAIRAFGPSQVIAPASFDPALPQVSPSVVFTPLPLETARPDYVGPALPRRTPLPYTRAWPRPTSRPARAGVPGD